MSINLDNILLYLPPALAVCHSAADYTEKQNLGPSSSNTEKTVIPSTRDALISNSQTTSHSNDKLTMSSRLHPEATINDMVNSKDMTHLWAECCPVSSDIGHSLTKESVPVDTTPRENPVAPVAWSTNDLPVSLPFVPSEDSTAAISTLHWSLQAVENTTRPAFPQILTDTASEVGFETPSKESTSSYTGQQRLPPMSQAAGDGFQAWLQSHQAMPANIDAVLNFDRI